MAFYLEHSSWVMQKCILHYFVAQKKKKKNTKTNSIGLFITIYIENNTCQFCCCCSLSLILTFGLLSLSLLGVFVVSDSRTLLLFLGFLFFSWILRWWCWVITVVVLGFPWFGIWFQTHMIGIKIFSPTFYISLYISAIITY